MLLSEPSTVVQHVVCCACAAFQMEEIVQKYGMVVISRAGSCLEKFIYESDVLTRHKVFSLMFYAYCNYELIFRMFAYFAHIQITSYLLPSLLLSERRYCATVHYVEMEIEP